MYNVMYITDIPKMNTQGYFEIQNKLSHRKMKIVLSWMQFFEKNFGFHVQGRSFVR
jgi:hypothetical protein